MSSYFLRGACLDHILAHMPTVERHATSPWARDFARSIQRQARRRGWRPSPKQEAVMRRLVAEIFDEARDVEVIE